METLFNGVALVTGAASGKPPRSLTISLLLLMSIIPVLPFLLTRQALAFARCWQEAPDALAARAGDRQGAGSSLALGGGALTRDSKRSAAQEEASYPAGSRPDRPHRLIDSLPISPHHSRRSIF